MIPQKTVDRMEMAEKRFFYCHERFILYGRGYDKRAMKNARTEMNKSLTALRRAYRTIIEMNKNERTIQGA